jgi:hypothetical protein
VARENQDPADPTGERRTKHEQQPRTNRTPAKKIVREYREQESGGDGAPSKKWWKN